MTSEGKKCFFAKVDFPALLAPTSAMYESSGNFISMMFVWSAAISPQSAAFTRVYFTLGRRTAD